LTSLSDLAGREVHVRESSSYFGSLSRLNERFASEGRAPIRIVPADELLETEDLLEMVNAGVMPITIADNHLADFWGEIFERITVHTDLVVATGGRIAWAFRRSSPELEQAVNEFVRANRKGTLVGNMLFRRYLKDASYLRNPGVDEDRRRFEAAVEFFRRYGDQYDLPYLLIAAQAYQESRIDQSKRSPAGAVGVMQILPSTAADPRVGMPDIEAMEPNIHAGVRYLRMLMDDYFDDPALDPLNRQLLAFAAYNAGPARVAGLRRTAAETGLDPNRWFGNVEVVAARQIGRETVNYVSNIYKYYIAYQLITRQQELKEAG
ncbi:MAG: transglycosylase SLT domain-containing protein, partial [Gemmatimonadetes bacterium]|nr:transglycosylase SLT domain-containing protein [Gemmatimonadota bacterium]